MENLFIKIFNMSITAGWLILAVIFLRLILKKAPKSIQWFMWILVAVRLACPFSLESILSLIPSSETLPPDIVYAEIPQIHSGIESFNSTVNPVISGSLTPNPAASVNPIQIVIAFASVIWIAGMIGLLMYAVISYIRLRVKMTGAVRLRDNIYQSENVDSPFVLGFIRPKIYIPFNMNEHIMNHVISHENSHIRHGDHLIKPLGFLLLIVYWFNPLIWVAYILLCRDIETACDERVIKQYDADEKKLYSIALLECGVRTKSITACPVAFGEVGVKSRVKHVLNYKKPAFWIIITALICCVFVTACFMTNPKTDAVDNDNDNNIDSSNAVRIGSMGDFVEMLGDNVQLYGFDTCLYTAPPISYVPMGDTGNWYIVSPNDYVVAYDQETEEINSLSLAEKDTKKLEFQIEGVGGYKISCSAGENFIVVNKETGKAVSLSSMNGFKKVDLDEWNSMFYDDPFYDIYDISGYDLDSCMYQSFGDGQRLYYMNGEVWLVLVGSNDDPMICHIWKLKTCTIKDFTAYNESNQAGLSAPQKYTLETTDDE